MPYYLPYYFGPFCSVTIASMHPSPAESRKLRYVTLNDQSRSHMQENKGSPYHGESDDHSRLSDAMTSTKSGGSVETEDDLIYLEKINNAKQDARSEIKLHEWVKYDFSKLDLDSVLGPAKDNIEYIHCDDCSLEQMIERFEVPCKPVVIRGLMDRSSLQSKLQRQGPVVFFYFLVAADGGL